MFLVDRAQGIICLGNQGPGGRLSRQCEGCREVLRLVVFVILSLYSMEIL